MEAPWLPAEVTTCDVTARHSALRSVERNLFVMRFGSFGGCLPNI